MSFIALWSQNGRFQLSNFKSVFVPFLTYDPESWIMTEIILSQGQAAEMRFFEESSMVWHFETECAAVKFAEPWMWNHFSSRLRKHRYIGSAMCPECSTKDWPGKSSWLNQRKIGWEVIQGLGRVTTPLTLLRLGVEPEELSEIAVDHEVFQVLLGLLPRDPH